MKHLKAFPNDPLENVIRNVFDFDVYKPETIEILADILDHHGYVYRSFYILFLIRLPASLVVKNLGLDAAREATKKKVLDIQFEPKGDTTLDNPKFGKEDPNNEPHSGGNTWAGGVSKIQFHSCVLLTSGIFRPVGGILLEWAAAGDTCVSTKGMISNR